MEERGSNGPQKIQGSEGLSNANWPAVESENRLENRVIAGIISTGVGMGIILGIVSMAFGTGYLSWMAAVTFALVGGAFLAIGLYRVVKSNGSTDEAGL